MHVILWNASMCCVMLSMNAYNSAVKQQFAGRSERPKAGILSLSWRSQLALTPLQNSALPVIEKEHTVNTKWLHRERAT